MTSDSIDTSVDQLINQHFAGKAVRKDLTKLIKEGANVPVYVLEYLLGMYCASDDEDIIRDGLETVKKVLAENYVRPDEAEKVKSMVRERGSYKIIDKVTVKLNEKRDVYEALATDRDSRACFERRGEKFMADLPALGRLRLERQGVAEVAGGDLCTYADADRFHSFRRDGSAAGRQVSVICLL